MFACISLSLGLLTGKCGPLIQCLCKLIMVSPILLNLHHSHRLTTWLSALIRMPIHILSLMYDLVKEIDKLSCFCVASCKLLCRPSPKDINRERNGVHKGANSNLLA